MFFEKTDSPAGMDFLKKTQSVRTLHCLPVVLRSGRTDCRGLWPFQWPYAFVGVSMSVNQRCFYVSMV
jgi:hypothetical protein